MKFKNFFFQINLVLQKTMSLLYGKCRWNISRKNPGELIIKREEGDELNNLRILISNQNSFLFCRNTSRVPSESREAMYRRAMHLITARCTSTAPGMETPYGTARNNSAFGVQVPQYFYIKQERPTPMPPLKV